MVQAIQSDTTVQMVKEAEESQNGGSNDQLAQQVLQMELMQQILTQMQSQEDNTKQAIALDPSMTSTANTQ